VVLTEELKIEEKVRKILSKKYGKSLTKRKLIVAYRSDGKPVKHEFDIVSADEMIVGEVKSDKYTKKAYHNTRFPRLLTACFYLNKTEAKKKLLVLTNETLYDHFKKDMDGLISDIEIMNIPAGKLKK
jgi:hypothetical protein